MKLIWTRIQKNVQKIIINQQSELKKIKTIEAEDQNTIKIKHNSSESHTRQNVHEKNQILTKRNLWSQGTWMKTKSEKWERN